MRQISIAFFDILILKGKPVLHKKRKDCNGLVAMANSCMCLNQSAHLLELGLRIRIRSDPVFLPGSGSGFQICLDPDLVFEFHWTRIQIGFQPRVWYKKSAERYLKVIYQKKT